MSADIRLSEGGEPQILVGANFLSRQDLTNDLRVSVGIALGGIAFTGGSVYATVKLFENDVADELYPLAAPGGGLTLGITMVKAGISVAISSIRNRRQLDNFQAEILV